MTTIATGYTATNKPVQIDLDSTGTVWITYTATGHRRRFNDGCYTDTPATDIRFMLTSAGYRLD